MSRDITMVVGLLQMMPCEDLVLLEKMFDGCLRRQEQELTACMKQIEKSVHQAANVFKHVYQPANERNLPKPFASALFGKAKASMDSFEVKNKHISKSDVSTYKRSMERALQKITDLAGLFHQKDTELSANLKSTGMGLVDKPEEMLQAQIEKLQRVQGEYQNMVFLMGNVQLARRIAEGLFEGNADKQRIFMQKPYGEVSQSLSAFSEEGMKGSEEA